MFRLRPMLVILLLVASLPTAGGCASKAAGRREAGYAVWDYQAGDFARAAERLRPLSDVTNEDYVLNNLRLGSAALAGGDLDEAEAAFLRAYEVINATGVNDPWRRTAAALFDEKVRVFRGEPFERAMANFYLGLVYYLREDYDNARGAFEGALFRLRDYVDARDTNQAERYTEFESDFAPALVMLARTWQHLGRDDLAAATFRQLGERRPDLAALADPSVHASANLLLIVESGEAPRKVTSDDGSIVGYAPTPQQVGPPSPLRVQIDGLTDAAGGGVARATLDLVRVAQARRWQSIDTIRATKSLIGSGLMVGGAGLGAYEIMRGDPRGETLALAAGLFAAGLLAKATSQADVRRWEMLPRAVYVVPLRVEPGRRDVTVSTSERFGGGVGQTVRGVPVPSGGHVTVHVRLLRPPFRTAERFTPAAGRPVLLASPG